MRRLLATVVAILLLLSACSAAIPTELLPTPRGRALDATPSAAAPNPDGEATLTDKATPQPTLEPLFEYNTPEPPPIVPWPEEREPGYGPNDTWAVYWYLCGSDLETEQGSATADLREMMSVSLPNNVDVIIQTGGAKRWQNDFVPEKRSCRYIYDDKGLRLLENNTNRNMGAKETFADFLRFCVENYPADHQVLILWNHGGGTVGGVAFDENYKDDSLMLDEMYAAFTEVLKVSEKEPPLDILGFDACLMATIDTAYAYKGVAKYLVASQEMEPGLGWDYKTMLEAFANEPRMSAKELGKIICDSYLLACERGGMGGAVTLSLTDLRLIGPLMTAYSNLGKEALAAAVDDPYFFAKLSRAAKSSENYGSNSVFEGYTNMVDLGDLAQKSADILPRYSQMVVDALEECVVYKVNGMFRSRASGLSCYHSYDYSQSAFGDFAKVAACEPYIHLYAYGISGRFPQISLEYIAAMRYETAAGAQAAVGEIPAAGDAPSIPSLSDLNNHPVEVDERGRATINVGADAAKLLTGVYYYLCYADYDKNLLMLLGNGNEIRADWRNGVFRYDFPGTWGALNGHFTYMELTFESDEYCLYSIPIQLNGEDCYMQVSLSGGVYTILGARRGITDNGMADKNLIPLQKGDKITTLHYTSKINASSNALKQIKMETFTLEEEPYFRQENLGDGDFVILFELEDARNNSIFSDTVSVLVENGNIEVGEAA